MCTQKEEGAMETRLGAWVEAPCGLLVGGAEAGHGGGLAGGGEAGGVERERAREGAILRPAHRLAERCAVRRSTA